MSLIVFSCITLLILVSDSQSHQYCLPISPPEHGFVEPNHIYRLYKFSCEDGYILRGHPYVYCDGYDSKEKPTCIKNSQSHQYCPPISPPEHGFVEPDHISRVYKFSCEDGYTLRGHTYVHCDRYDSREKPTCIKNVCEDLPNPHNGQVDCDEGPLIPGKICRFSCFSGYRLQGDLTRICKFNLQWSGSAKCYPIPNVCQNPLPPENGAVECDKGDLIPGKACHFSCSEGYKLQGVRVRRCMSDYQWSGLVKCVPIPGYLLELNQAAELVINPSGKSQSQPAGKGFSLTCQGQAEDTELFTELKWFGPKGELIEGTSGAIEVFRVDSALLLVFREPTADHSGKYNCTAVYDRTYKLHAGVDLVFYQDITWDECPTKQALVINTDGKIRCRVSANPPALISWEKDGQTLSERYITESDGIKVTAVNEEDTGNFLVRAFVQHTGRFQSRTIRVEVHENSYAEPANHNSRVFQTTNAPNSHYVTKNYIPSSQVNNNDRCHNHQCEQLCKIEENGPHCRCCAGYKLNFDNTTCRLNNPSNVDRGCIARNSKKRGDVKVSTCPEGYILDSERKSCTDINECEEDKFGCSDTCVNIPGNAYCTCPRGFTLDTDKKTCIDIDECSSEGRCQHNCNNTYGSYFCSCRPGYILIDGYKCLGCRTNSYWSYERHGCVDCPKNSHTDSEGKMSIKDCVCNSGFTGSPGDYITCEDIDECSVNNFDCSHTCINIPGSAYCICPKGFMLDSDNKTCIDIDECSIKNGGCEGLCINTNGSFNCVCLEGFIASKKDRYSCDDIDECAENNGGCEHSCINYRGGFYCACKHGYRLDSTLKNCTGIQCPKLPQPHYSEIYCTYKESLNQTLTVLPEQNSYRAGTRCTFKCYKGFKITQDNNKLKCGKDGTWIGTLPECKPQSCPSLNVPENGQIHPASCSTRGAVVKQKCTFSCHAGYILEGHAIFQCRNNLTWNKEDIPVCNLERTQPIIKCPQDIRVALAQGEATHNITVSEPTTNMEYYEVHPPWLTINEPVEFQVGETKIIFTAVSPFNETAQCEMTVTILDEEPPTFHFCPDPIKIEGAKGNGEFVTWEEPVVSDNVELVSVFSLLEPNTTLTPGTYFVEYVARDSSGNIATCSFDISVIRMNCSDLRDPAHGKANCMDWMYGKLCNPECDAGYMRYPEDTLYYSCDDTGVWEPNDFISECLQYTPATSPTCQDGFEFKKVDGTGEEVCIECPVNTTWSATIRKCENK